jgi:predicted aspartyl protease
LIAKSFQGYVYHQIKNNSVNCFLKINIFWKKNRESSIKISFLKKLSDIERKTYKFFIKESRIKIRNKKIRIEIEISTTKRIKLWFLREEKKKKRKEKVN